MDLRCHNKPLVQIGQPGFESNRQKTKTNLLKNGFQSFVNQSDFDNWILEYANEAIYNM